MADVATSSPPAEVPPAPVPEPAVAAAPEAVASAAAPTAAPAKPAEKLVKTEFVYADGAFGDAKLVGSWANWIPIQMFYEGEGLWAVLTPVPLGKHEFRFIVDGEWKVSSHHPTIGSEADDTLNNYREVVMPPPPPEKKPKVTGRQWSEVKRKNCVIM